MKTIIFITTVFLSLTVVNGQTEPINKLDINNKKDGKWKIYLDIKWNKVDSSKAVFYRYTWFDHGVNIQPMGAGGGKKSIMKSSSDSSIEKGKIKILDGEYKWYKDGKLKYVHVFKSGEYVSYKEYTSKEKLESSFDYTKGCKGQPHSWTIYIYDKNGNVTMTSPICKDKSGKWPKMSD